MNNLMKKAQHTQHHIDAILETRHTGINLVGAAIITLAVAMVIGYFIVPYFIIDYDDSSNMQAAYASGHHYIYTVMTNDGQEIPIDIPYEASGGDDGFFGKGGQLRSEHTLNTILAGMTVNSRIVQHHENSILKFEYNDGTTYETETRPYTKLIRNETKSVSYVGNIFTYLSKLNNYQQEWEKYKKDLDDWLKIPKTITRTSVITTPGTTQTITNTTVVNVTTTTTVNTTSTEFGALVIKPSGAVTNLKQPVMFGNHISLGSSGYIYLNDMQHEFQPGIGTVHIPDVKAVATMSPPSLKNTSIKIEDGASTWASVIYDIVHYNTAQPRISSDAHGITVPRTITTTPPTTPIYSDTPYAWQIEAPTYGSHFGSVTNVDIYQMSSTNPITKIEIREKGASIPGQNLLPNLAIYVQAMTPAAENTVLKAQKHYTHTLKAHESLKMINCEQTVIEPGNSTPYIYTLYGRLGYLIPQWKSIHYDQSAQPHIRGQSFLNNPVMDNPGTTFERVCTLDVAPVFNHDDVQIMIKSYWLYNRIGGSISLENLDKNTEILVGGKSTHGGGPDTYKAFTSDADGKFYMKFSQYNNHEKFSERSNIGFLAPLSTVTTVNTLIPQPKTITNTYTITTTGTNQTVVDTLPNPDLPDQPLPPVHPGVIPGATFYTKDLTGTHDDILIDTANNYMVRAQLSENDTVIYDARTYVKVPIAEDITVNKLQLKHTETGNSLPLPYLHGDYHAFTHGSAGLMVPVVPGYDSFEIVINDAKKSMLLKYKDVLGAPQIHLTEEKPSRTNKITNSTTPGEGRVTMGEVSASAVATVVPSADGVLKAAFRATAHGEIKLTNVYELDREIPVNPPLPCTGVVMYKGDAWSCSPLSVSVSIYKNGDFVSRQELGVDDDPHVEDVVNEIHGTQNHVQSIKYRYPDISFIGTAFIPNVEPGDVIDFVVTTSIVGMIDGSYEAPTGWSIEKETGIVEGTILLRAASIQTGF